MEGQWVVLRKKSCLNNTRKLDVSQRESLLRIGCIEALISIGSHLQLERLWSRDDNVGVQESISTEPIFSWTNSVSGSLINANKVISRAKSSDGSSEFSHVAFEWSSEHEGVGSISLPFNGTEVLLDSNTGCVAKVGQISRSAFNPRSVVEGFDDGRWASVVLHASRRCCNDKKEQVKKYCKSWAISHVTQHESCTEVSWEYCVRDPSVESALDHGIPWRSHLKTVPYPCPSYCRGSCWSWSSTSWSLVLHWIQQTRQQGWRILFPCQCKLFVNAFVVKILFNKIVSKNTTHCAVLRFLHKVLAVVLQQ